MKNILLAFSIITTFSCMAQTDIPAAVQASFNKNFPGIAVKKWEKEAGNYEAEFKKDGKNMSATFTAKGDWLETETDIDVASLPA
ncbi:MAG TPA: PepSY-like domain-containing protein, partial [Chitinophagaceae bacterium]|nr:PepSY-like domain-containing protein [Chitinophagaceae bacterium]